MTSMAIAASDIQQSSSHEGMSLSSVFKSAAQTAWNGVKLAGSLAYGFVKANPIVSAVGADLLLTGGALTQQVIVAGVQTVAGALGEVATSAGSGLWGMVFGR